MHSQGKGRKMISTEALKPRSLLDMNHSYSEGNSNMIKSRAELFSGQFIEPVKYN